MRAAPLFLALGLLIPFTPAQAAGPNLITMNGHGEASGAPDTANLSAGVNTEAPTAAASLSANSSRMQNVMAALQKLGVPGRDSRTGNFSILPQYSDGKDGPRHVISYRVDNQVTVRLEDIGKLGDTMDALVSAGANEMNGVSFAIHDDAALLEKARQAAVADARQKAETFASAAGVALGPILSITENGDSGPRPIFAAPAIRALGVPVAPGEQNVNANVTISWEIK